MPESLLVVDDLAAAHDSAVRAPRGDSLRVGAESIVAVLGRNRAPLRALSRPLGTVGGAVTAGSIRFAGQDRPRHEASWAVRAGDGTAPPTSGVLSETVESDEAITSLTTAGGEVTP